MLALIEVRHALTHLGPHLNVWGLIFENPLVWLLLMIFIIIPAIVGAMQGWTSTTPCPQCGHLSLHHDKDGCNERKSGFDDRGYVDFIPCGCKWTPEKIQANRRAVR